MTAPPPVEPICVKVNDAARMIGVGRTKLYELDTRNNHDFRTVMGRVAGIAARGAI